MRDYESVDEHGGAYERASAIYTNLSYELKNNPDLTVSQKKAIQHDIDLLKKIGLDVPYMTELASLLREEGVDLDDDILTVDEMVDKLCQL